MKIIDLTNAYRTHLIAENNIAAYEASYPRLFEHYNRYWARTDREYSNLTDHDLEHHRALIRTGLKEALLAIEKTNLSVTNMEAVLFVGRNTSNGHAFVDKNKIIVWLPVETYTTKTLARVFVMHEIVHARHYSLSPDFYFHSESERRHTGRQLITEGLASLLTAELLKMDDKEALWADHLTDEKASDWMRQCSTRQDELRQFILSQFDAHHKSIGLFYANNPEDIFHFRSGYHVGMQIMREICSREQVPALKLLEYPRTDLERLTKETLTVG